jgi:alkylation response protein AidB-like acyl-CoA dehydrogenase
LTRYVPTAWSEVPDFGLAPDLEDLRSAGQRFATRELAPRVREAERGHGWPPDVMRVLEDFQLRAVDLPIALGGAAGGALPKVVLLEALAHGDPGGLPAADHPGPAAGACMACPKPDVAADVVRECLRGVAQAPLVVVHDTTWPDRIEWAPAWPPARWAWVSEGDNLALLDVANASSMPVEALGFRASGGMTVDLRDRRVEGTWHLAAGTGVAIRGRARLWAAAVAVGIAQDAFDATIAYTTERVVFGKPVAHHQGNAFDLAVSATALHAARLSVYDAAARYDADDPFAGFWATQAWQMAIDNAIALTDLGIQLLGGHGFLVDHLAEKRFREARMVGLLLGGRDAADADIAAQVLDVPDPIFSSR